MQIYCYRGRPCHKPISDELFFTCVSELATNLDKTYMNLHDPACSYLAYFCILIMIVFTVHFRLDVSYQFLLLFGVAAMLRSKFALLALKL